MHWFGIGFSLLTTIAGIIFYMQLNDFNLFIFLFGIAIAVGAFPFVFGTVLENKKQLEIDEMFLEFSRNLAESVNTGTPISKSIINMSKKNYGSLTPYIQKLANQISLGIPIHQALENFGYDVGSPVISRAIALIMEAERAGGEIDYILDSVAKSIAEVEKLKKERKASIYNLVVQGYIIFFIFIGIMLVMEFKILPLTGDFSGLGSITNLGSVNSLTNTPSSSGGGVSPEQFSAPFLYLLLTQGIFTGLTIGKLSEGSVKSGVKHSFVLAVAALLISTGAKLLF
jgi:archaeal flagellar protein FlaJ